jgi:hypothetical protein
MRQGGQDVGRRRRRADLGEGVDGESQTRGGIATVHLIEEQHLFNG